MFNWLFWLMLFVAGLEWIADWKDWRTIRYITKPGALILLLAWFTQVGQWQGPLEWFGVGLIASLVGDIALLLPPRFFLTGLGAFFLAHIAYIIGFSSQPLVLQWGGLVPVVVIGGVFTALNGQIRHGLKAQGKTSLTLPAMAYAVILSIMWLMALSTFMRPQWSFGPAMLVSLGATLFLISDSTLALNRFVRPIRYGNLVVMVTYHLAQILITIGVLQQFAK